MSEPVDPERARIERERDAYLKALYALTRKEITFTKEELREMEENGLTLDEIISNLEASLGR
jgi:hypothetical protein